MNTDQPSACGKPDSFVGQVGNLRRVDNPPPAICEHPPSGESDDLQALLTRQQLRERANRLYMMGELNLAVQLLEQAAAAPESGVHV